MICIITGDIIGSRKINENWLKLLKEALKFIGKKESNWEIFRGDSFQLKLAPIDAFKAAVYIKACIKSANKADVRMGIGIGQNQGKATKISESSGDAYIYSGVAFDGLKNEKVNLAIKTSVEAYDYELNICIKLALIAMDNWGAATAEVIKFSIEHEGLLQSELAALSGRTQSSVSEALKRGRFSEIMELDTLFRKKTIELLAC